MNSSRKTRTSVNLGLLILRVVVGITFVMHGWQKFNEWTISGTTSNFAEMGVPLPEIAAPFAAFTELIGGIALIVGLFSRIAGLSLAVVMAGSIYFVHAPAGFFVSDGGFEFVMVLGAAALAIAFAGPGRIALGGGLTHRRGVSVFA